MISTDEQDGWAYVATGSETYAQWVRHWTRVRAGQPATTRRPVRRGRVIVPQRSV